MVQKGLVWRKERMCVWSRLVRRKLDATGKRCKKGRPLLLPV